MIQEFTLAQLVKKYGTKAQKATMKKKGNLTGKEFLLLIKSVEQEWETYKVEGRGSNRIILCSGRRSKKAERVDKRSNNGQGQLIGEFELKSMVVSYLINNDNKVDPMSANKWSTELAILDGKLTRALYGAKGVYLEEIQEQFSGAIKDYKKADSDMDMLEEFLQVTLKNIKSSIVSVFIKLARDKIIIHKTERWGCTTKNIYRKLTLNEIKQIASARNDLLTTHGIKSSDLFKSNKKEVKAFKSEFEKLLADELNLKFYYEAHCCKLKDIDLVKRDYLDEEGELNFACNLTEEYAYIMTDVYKEKQSKHALELAKGREKNIFNKSDSDRIQDIKFMEQYVPMWDILLKYFRCTRSMKSNLPSVDESASTTIEINGIEIEVSNIQKRKNPLSTFQAIRMVAEMNQ